MGDEPASYFSMKILTAAEMRAADAATTAEHGIPSITLMENAGAAVARFVLEELPDAEHGDMRIVALCGKGNNGGDGFVAARILAEAGCDVHVLLLGRAAEVQGDAQKALERLKAAELVPIEAPDEAALAEPTIAELLDGAELFLDAVLGTGFRPPMRGVATALGEWLAAHPEAPVVSVDLPSGWDADSRAMRAAGGLSVGCGGHLYRAEAGARIGFSDAWRSPGCGHRLARRRRELRDRPALGRGREAHHGDAARAGQQ